MTEDVLVKRQDAVVEIRLNRPAKKNALTHAMYGAMADAIESAEKDAAVRAILIGAEGDVFCAGNDLADFAAFARQSGSDGLQGLQFLRTLISAEKPVIAAVAGDGIGIGLTMLLHCDLVVIAEDAKLMAPFTMLGLTPEGASSMILPTLIGHTRAYAVLALGQVVSGREAAQIGLATVTRSARRSRRRGQKAGRRMLRPTARGHAHHQAPAEGPGGDPGADRAGRRLFPRAARLARGARGF